MRESGDILPKAQEQNNGSHFFVPRGKFLVMDRLLISENIFVFLFFQWETILLKNYLFVHITTAPKSSVLLLILPSTAYYNYNTEYKVISFKKTITNECKTRDNWRIGKDRKVQGDNEAISDSVIGSSLSTESC